MISNLVDFGRALELAEHAVRDAEEAWPRLRDDPDTTLIHAAACISADLLRRVQRMDLQLRSASRAGVVDL